MSTSLKRNSEATADIQYHITTAGEITEAQWTICADTFNRHYGVWSSRITPSMGPWIPGARIVLSKSDLKAQSLPNGAFNILITAAMSNRIPIEPIGHCIVSQWMHNGARVWWITQIVVRSGYRNQKHAKRMLEALAAHHNIGKRPGVRDLVGVFSPHPFAICAVLRVFGKGIEHSRLRRDSGSDVVEASELLLEQSQCKALLEGAPIEHVRTAKMHPETMSAFTGFYIDHAEPERALQKACDKLGGTKGFFRELDDGHEYLCVVNGGDLVES